MPYIHPSLSRSTPLHPGTKGLKRGGPLQTRTRLERKTKLRQRNPERLARLRSEQFGPQSEVCRNLPCIFCGMSPPSDPQHVVCRGMGGVKGKDHHTVPCCREHHDLIHSQGSSALPVTHEHLAALLHLTLQLLAVRPDLLPLPIPEEEIE